MTHETTDASQQDALRRAVQLVLAMHEHPESNVPGYTVKLDPMAERQLRAALHSRNDDWYQPIALVAQRFRCAECDVPQNARPWCHPERVVREGTQAGCRYWYCAECAKTLAESDVPRVIACPRTDLPRPHANNPDKYEAFPHDHDPSGWAVRTVGRPGSLRMPEALAKALAFALNTLADGKPLMAGTYDLSGRIGGSYTVYDGPTDGI